MFSPDESQLRHWLIDQLVTITGCSRGDIDCEALLNDLGVGSSEAVTLCGQLTELLNRPVSPVDCWEHPTIAELARFLTTSERDSEVVAADRRTAMAEPIAVVGLGCRFPGGIVGPESFWQFLGENRSAVGEVPPERWPLFDDGSPQTAAAMSRTTRWGAFLSDIDMFDADFFDISPSEAAKMDPQQRLLLEVVWEAFEHAGIPADSLRRTQTGVFVGACSTDYAHLLLNDLGQVDAYSGTGGAMSIIANRISYFFDFRGPSVAVDTACSSSLVAIHLACQHLRAGDAGLAIAAGVNLLLSPGITRSFDSAETMSPTGRCHAFDAAADGFVRGEGCGAVVLKRLSDARRDGDRVLAVIRGSAVNSDGRSNGLMAPNSGAQMAVLHAACANAEVSARDIDYVEAHGTGTLLGDPIEARALGRVLGRGRRLGDELLLGAVKSGLGHLEAAAGIAGFIKAVLALHHAHLPANLGFAEPNPHIPFTKLGLKVIAEPQAWPTTGHPRLAGVSSFGFGGTNAHVILEQGSDPVQPEASTPHPGASVTTLIVTGKTEKRLADMAGMLANWMDGAGTDVSLTRVAHTLNHHRTRQPKFATVAARDRSQAIAGLRALAAGRAADGLVAAHRGECRPGIVFVFSGQGSQWAGMGRQLLRDEPAFAVAIDQLEPDFVTQVGFSLREVIASGAPVAGIDRIQPVLVGMQLALTSLWRSYGVIPEAVIGHSMGEVTAAVVAGALTSAEGFRVIAARSALMARLSGQGAMALLEMDGNGIETLIADYPDVTLAVHVSPRQSVIAGPPADVDALVAEVAASDLMARRIEVDVASHHPMVDAVLPELRAALSGLSPRTPTVRLIGTAIVDTEPTFDAQYWAANLRNPVRFSQAIATAGADYTTFVEVSPHPVLTFAISDTLAQSHHHSIATLSRGEDELLTFHTNLNAAHTTHPPDTDHPPGPHPVLPPTPWRHDRHWLPTKKCTPTTVFGSNAGSLLGEHIVVADQSLDVWQAQIAPDGKPYPGSHRIQGVDVVPVSVLLQTLLGAAIDSGSAALNDIRFEHPIVLDRPRTVQVVAESRDLLAVVSAPRDGHSRWLTHVTARLVSAAPKPGLRIDGRAVRDCDEIPSLTELFERWGVEGHAFDWSVRALRRGGTGIVADVDLKEASITALVDAAVHVARLADESDPRLLIPASADSVQLGAALTGPHGCVEILRRKVEDAMLVVDITLRNSDGAMCLHIAGLRCAELESTAVPVDADPRSLVHTVEWQSWQGDTTLSPPETGTVSVVGADKTAAAELSDELAAAGFGVTDSSTARYVVFLAAVPRAGADIDVAADMSVELSETVRRLAERDHRNPATLWVVTRGVHEANGDESLPQSCLWGLARVIAAEQPQLWGGLVDVSVGEGCQDMATALSRLLPAAAQSTLRIELGEILAAQLVPLAEQPARAPFQCRADATYLITGGMGALGLRIADWLADRGARRLLLVGRTPLPARRRWDEAHSAAYEKTAAIQALERRGVAVEAVALDVGSPAAIEELLARRDRDGAPPIRGAVHAAGVVDDKLLTDADRGTMRTVMWPKIAGAQALHQAFPPGSLDFLFFTASAGAIYGVPGQGAYAAANAYLDCLARTRHQQGCRSLSLDWVAWQGIGFASDADIAVAELDRMGSRPVSSHEAFAAWDYVARCDIAQAVIAPLSDAGSDDQPPSSPTLSQLSGDELVSELQTALRQILARELRLSEQDVEADQPFAELGLNSLMAMSIRRQTEQLTGTELSATMLWNHPTIGSLAQYLAAMLSPQQTAGGVKAASRPPSNVLDALFDQAEAAS